MRSCGWEKRTAAEEHHRGATCSHVHMDHALHLALERMSTYHVDILPVVNRADIHRLEGVVMLKDVLQSYGVESMDQGCQRGKDRCVHSPGAKLWRFGREVEQ